MELQTCLLYFLKFTLALTMVTLSKNILISSQHYDCPMAQHISPCVCSERTKGLDITCYNVSLIQLREVLDAISYTRQRLFYLRLKQIHLLKLTSYYLEGLDVRNLVATDNGISELNEDSFSTDNTNMESLDLSKNNLNHVPTKSLEVLSSLASLNMDYNRIETLHDRCFTGLVSLLWLSLFGNLIKVIGNSAFDGTETSLTRLNLGNNRLSSVPSLQLKKVSCLKSLQLSNNNISSLSPSELAHLPRSVSELDFSGNDLTDLTDGTFSSLPLLSALDLEKNNIENIDDGAFNGLEDSLEWLKLGDNLLSSIPHRSFRNLTRLRRLDLRGNIIEDIPDHAFHHYGSNLKFIFLQRNRISNIGKKAFHSLKSVEWLYLQSNRLSTLPNVAFSNVMDHLHVLDVHGNPLHCDCHSVWFRSWMLNGGSSVINLPKETRCHSPGNLHRQPVIQVDDNNLTCASGRVRPMLLLISSLYFVGQSMVSDFN